MTHSQAEVVKKRKLSSYLRTSREQQSESLTDSSLQGICKAQIDQYMMAAKPDPERDPLVWRKLNSQFSKFYHISLENICLFVLLTHLLNVYLVQQVTYQQRREMP